METMETIGYVFPNDYHVPWSLMIVLYPYITGLVAGAFVVSSLYHLFGIESLKPIARFSLAASLAFLLFAPLPLLLHLGHPERCLNVVITPNPSSAMAGFGFLYTFYLLVLIFEIWLIFRKDIVMYARQSRGIKRFFYKTLALYTYDISDKALALDKKLIQVFAAIGLPAACGLHGYVGFIFGALKSNPWWSTPLMPIIFLFSAVVSGIAALIILYQAFMWAKDMEIDRPCLETLVRWLWLFMILAVTLESLEIVTLAYEGAEEWEIIRQLLTTKLAFSFLAVQVIGGSLIPFLLLMWLVLMNKYLRKEALIVGSLFAAGLLLIQVFSMRWNVVVGGQLFSKSLAGLRDSYFPEFLGREGILSSLIVFIMPFIVLLIFERILPTFKVRYRESAAEIPATDPKV